MGSFTGTSFNDLILRNQLSSGVMTDPAGLMGTLGVGPQRHRRRRENDVVEAGDDGDIIAGGAGRGTIQGGLGMNFIDGGTGDDHRRPD